jgi:signal transduction histidine kinase
MFMTDGRAARPLRLERRTEERSRAALRTLGGCSMHDGTPLPKGRRAWAPRAAYWWVPAVGGAALLASAGLRMDWMSWGAVGIMAALGLATGLFAFPVDRTTYVSFSSAVYVASVALFGAFAGVWVVAVSTAILEVLCFRRGVELALRDAGVKVVALFVAAVAYAASGGEIPAGMMTFATAARFLIMFAVFGGVNGLGAILFVEAGATSRYARWAAGRGALIELAMLPLGLLMVASYTPGEPATFPLLVIVLMVSGAAAKSLWDTRQSLMERVDELKALNGLARALSSSLKLDTLVERLYGETANLLKASVVVVSFCDEKTSELESRGCHSATGPPLFWRSGLDSMPMGWVAARREPLLVRDVDTEAGRLGLVEARSGEPANVRSRSWLSVPLLSGEHLVGVLSFGSPATGAFDREQLEFVINIGSQVARALENARLYEGLEKSRATVEEWNRTLERAVDERTEELERARAELEALNEGLEARVDERTRELEKVQEKIVQSGRLAAVGELAAGIAHELNNPLGGILGYAQYDLEKLAPRREVGLSPVEMEKVFGHLVYIERESQRCRAIVENLLKFAEGAPPAALKVSVNDILRETLDFTERQLAVRGIGVETSVDESVPAVVGDPQELKQVFANIILNARKAMTTGGVLRITTGAVRGADGAETVAVAFSDTGCGIARDDLRRIFEPFFTTHEVGEGAGLGLSVSYGIVKNHKGTIEVQSEIGAGSTFTVRLPAATSA